MTDLAPAPLAAALADRYRFERRIGAGGMATVYLAEDLKHGRHVAVKVLSEELAASVGAERFLREIRITAALQHPNILTLIDSGEAAGLLYYVMPYVDGESLRTRLVRAAGPLPQEEALRILREMLDALAHAHGLGLVHRDVKPENVMLTGRHAMMLDFGVAKAVQTARDGRPRVAAEPDALTSVGISLGTPAYMAPEQVAGDPGVDHRADLYSVGMVAYEMLAGRVPFTGKLHEVLAAQVTATPTPLRQLNASVPVPLAQIVMRLLAKRPEERPQSADAVLKLLDAMAAPQGVWSRLESRLGRAGAIAATVVVVGAVVGGLGLATKRTRDAAWVRDVARPEIVRLLDAARADSAFPLAVEALARAPQDTALATLWERVSKTVVRPTAPEGVTLTWSPATGERQWQAALEEGDSLRLPRANVLVRFEVAGMPSRTILLAGAGRTPAEIPIASDTGRDAWMDLVPGAETAPVMPGLSAIEPLRVGPYLLDRFEVTNAEYKRFVDAGGYTDAQWWTEPIRAEGRVVPFAEVGTRFVDRTGRPGPATWEGGTFAPEAAKLPVGGISWYEAMAYARFVGKELPTIYHWSRAAGTGAMASIVPTSNFGSDRARAVGSGSAISPFGTEDMAGNVREWVSNAFDTQHFILGGGHSDQTYAFVDAYAQDPINRAEINGLRLMRRLADDSTPVAAWAAIPRQFRDYAKERPVGDAVYASLLGTFDYDRLPLDARVESVDSSAAEYVVERVTLAPVYGSERLPLLIYRPRATGVRRQVVLVFPGSGAFNETQRNDARGLAIDAIVASGRIVVYPTYASTYERTHTLLSDSPSETAQYRDHVAMWVKDVHRALDYMETREDVDASKMAYYGMSFGGRLAPIVLAGEPRLRAALLSIAGLKMERTRPETDPLNYLPRVTVPVLMLNGEFDHYFPVETSQRPFFRLLGTPAAQKRHVIFAGGHSVPRTMLIAEGLRWLDTYLGAVGR